MAFPTSPTNGQKYLHGSITYVYVSSTGTWDIWDPNQEAPDMSGANILAQLVTVDGSGSGLDADLLDGQSGSYYTGYTDTAIANLADSAPATLNTLNELAAALGDDPNFATSVTNSIATKLNSSSYTAADVLAKIKTVDGSGSGLDADTLDGLHASQIVPTKAAIDALAVDAGTLDGYQASGLARLNTQNGGSIYFTDVNRYWMSTGGSNNWGIYWNTSNNQIQFHGSGNNRAYIDCNNGAIYSANNITAAGDVISNSDIRLKSDIKPINNPIETVKALNGKTYIKDDKASIGLIAQEVEEVLPELVHTASDEMGTKSVAYGNIVAVLIEAVKEQQKQIDELKEKLNGI